MRRSLTAAFLTATILTLTAGTCASAPPRAGGASMVPGSVRPAVLRRLVLLLDGVPHEVMDSVQRAGYFRAFEPAGAVISTFPSLTGVAYQDIWHEPPPAGYEDRYFDAGENRMAGGLLEHIMKGTGGEGFHRHVEVAPNPVTGGLAYVAPGVFAEWELAALRREVETRAVWDTTIVAYLVSTDALGHRAGRAAMADFLVQVDTLLEGFRARYGARLRIDIISDHGNDLVPTHLAPLEEALLAAGLRRTDRLELPGDVVVPSFGLVGAAFAFAAEGDRDRLARALATTPGVELVARTGPHRAVEVRGPTGRAMVQGDSTGARYRYMPLEGDPLGLAPALARLQAAGVADAEGWAPDSAWLAASHATPFVDSVRRLVEGMHEAVVHQASVVVSLAPGWHWGDPGADMLVQVTGTHGSLRTTSSMATVLSTHVTPPPLLRANQVAALLGLR